MQGRTILRERGWGQLWFGTFPKLNTDFTVVFLDNAETASQNSCHTKPGIVLTASSR